jgi:hypothetical protein
MIRTDITYVDRDGRLTQAGFQALRWSLNDLSDVALTAPATGNLLTYNGTAWVNTVPMPLLGTITTTSGATQSLTGLTLTPYKFLRLVIAGVSGNTATWALAIDGLTITSTYAAVNVIRGMMEIDLTDGTFVATTINASPGVSNLATTYAGDNSITTATTTITASITTGTFDAGVIRVYGIR